MRLDSAAAAALADDAATLALLHDREPNAELLAGLREFGFPDNLALLPAGDQTKAAFQLMRDAIGMLPKDLDAACLDHLASDYAAIYLTGAAGASPCESVWLSDDHLACQEAMFELRSLYAESGLAAPDWRRRPDDHLVYQLQFLAHRLERGASEENLSALADFLDIHLLRWLPDFARRIASRCDTVFYAALASLTHAWCEQLRENLTRHLGVPRPGREEIEARLCSQRQARPAVAPVNFLPGATGPSW